MLFGDCKRWRIGPTLFLLMWGRNVWGMLGCRHALLNLTSLSAVSPGNQLCVCTLEVCLVDSILLILLSELWPFSFGSHPLVLPGCHFYFHFYFDMNPIIPGILDVVRCSSVVWLQLKIRLSRYLRVGSPFTYELCNEDVCSECVCSEDEAWLRMRPTHVDKCQKDQDRTVMPSLR